jgi:hypothetical protein
MIGRLIDIMLSVADEAQNGRVHCASDLKAEFVEVSKMLQEYVEGSGNRESVWRCYQRSLLSGRIEPSWNTDIGMSVDVPSDDDHTDSPEDETEDEADLWNVKMLNCGASKMDAEFCDSYISKDESV